MEYTWELFTLDLLARRHKSSSLNTSSHELFPDFHDNVNVRRVICDAHESNSSWALHRDSVLPESLKSNRHKTVGAEHNHKYFDQGAELSEYVFKFTE